MKALVTGGTGFLGSHIVCALLLRGNDVVVFDRRIRGKGLDDEVLARLTVIEDDICNFDAVRRAAQGCSTIFHCAAMVGMEAYSKQPAKTMDTEEIGLRHVCRAALEGRDVNVVYASSSAVYGTAGGAVGLREDLPVAPVSNYGVAKRFNEVYLASEFAEHGLSSAAMRIFNMYGPGQDDRLVIPRFIRSALAGTDLAIYGDGAQTRDFIYVDDVVDAMFAGGEQEKGHATINVCSGQEVAVRDLAEMIIRLAGSRSRITFKEPPAERVTFEQSRCFGSREKMQRLAGVRAAIPIEDGLRRTIASIASAS